MKSLRAQCFIICLQLSVQRLFLRSASGQTWVDPDPETGDPETGGADGCHPREVHVCSDFDMQPTLPFFVFIFQLTPTHSKSRGQLVEETINLAPVPTTILHHSLDVDSHCSFQFIEQIVCIIVVKATLHQQHPSEGPNEASAIHSTIWSVSFPSYPKTANSYVQPEYLCPSSSSDSRSLCKKRKRHYATHLREY